MTKQHDIEDPLERAATLGVIGSSGRKTVKPATPITETSAAGKREGRAEKRARKGQYVYLPHDLIRYLKYQAADRELEISEVVEEAIREHRERHQG